MAEARRLDEAATRKRDAALEEERRAELQAIEDRRVAREQLAEARREESAAEEAERAEQHLAYREQVRAEREAERAAFEALPENQWLKKHCQLQLPPATHVMHCDPLCWRETIQPCPEYRCTAKPPDPSWLTNANAAACATARGSTTRRARAVGEDRPPE